MHEIMKRLSLFKKEKNRRRDSTATNSTAMSNSSVAAVGIVNRTPEPHGNIPSSNSGNAAFTHPCAQNAPHNAMIDAYELRIEELGQLIVEQGRHLDESSNRSRQLASENVMLREKMATGLENLRTSSTMQSKSPLKNIMNSQKKGSADEAKTMQKYKEENTLLQQQAALMVEELGVTNRHISELDMTVASLEKELKASWDNNCKRMYWW